MPRPAVPAVALWKTEKACFECSAYEGEYRGTLIRIERLTDPNDDGPYYGKFATETRWDGWVADGLEGLKPRWSLVAECYRTRREIIVELVRYIDGKISGAR
jgi:hypothetical protein